MLEKILVGVDGSEYSETALQHGLHLAQTFHATIHGIHVIDIVQVESPLLYDLAGAIGAAPLLNLTTQMRQNLELRGEQLLQQFRQACERAQVPRVEHLVTGVVPTEILRVADNMDLVLLGRGGLHTGLSKALLGSVVATVVRQSGKPIMITPRGYCLPRKPLLATDGSPSAIAALDYAAHFAKALDMPLQVVHCTTEAATGGLRLLDAARAYLVGLGVECDTALCFGDPHEELLRYVRDQGHDLLFSGAFGHNRMVEWVLGSTTQYLLHTCPVPMILCHTPLLSHPVLVPQEVPA
jgi:nucleotide-binding universal stress UspA family protein